MTVAVVAIIHPLPERRADVVAAYEAAVARVHAEDEGCELYAMHEDDDRLVLIEKWTSQEALAAHSTSPALDELRARVDGLVTRPAEVLILRPHPAGTDAQGVL
jgi:quinol monooxygenase YgiN